MLIDYISNFKNALEVIESFEKNVTGAFFNEGQKKTTEALIHRHVYYQRSLWPFKVNVELIRILCPQYFGEHEAFILEEIKDLENYSKVRVLEEFRKLLKPLRIFFKATEEERQSLCSAFDSEEKQRMNEAIHNFFESCMYSCIAMSVSAIESRLLKLMALAHPESKSELEKKTLGQLIFEYIENQDKYKYVIPDKHMPLLQLCNTYRTVSVHPKKGQIKKTIVNSIFNLSLEFLTDNETRPETVKASLTV